MVRKGLKVAIPLYHFRKTAPRQESMGGPHLIMKVWGKPHLVRESMGLRLVRIRECHASTVGMPACKYTHGNDLNL